MDYCVFTDAPLYTLKNIFTATTGIRDLEQAAERLAAHALYLIEAENETKVVYDSSMVKELFR